MSKPCKDCTGHIGKHDIWCQHYASDKPENPGECDACTYPTEQLTFYEPLWLCYLCERTKSGLAERYPKDYPDKNVLQHVCYVANVILDTLT